CRRTCRPPDMPPDIAVPSLYDWGDGLRALPAGCRRADALPAGQAGRGRATRARTEARRQARVERRAVPALSGGARGDGARVARPEPLPRRRRISAARG